MKKQTTTSEFSNETETSTCANARLCAGTKLVSMTNFVLQEYEKRNAYYNQDDKVLSKIKKYAEFLKQPISIWQFIPCDLDGNILEKPNNYDDKIIWLEGENRVYQEAEYRVVFPGFMVMETRPNPEYSKSISDSNSLLNVFWFSNITQQWIISKGLRKIEDLVIFGLTANLEACI
ncbi:MAG: hypothetical protein ACK4IZ_03285 [Flavobacterium sp.]|uniref:hypothetical protein n=1 Tax=Flavobacterium sp. TaxID=239 RepID=UPI00391AA24A